MELTGFIKNYEWGKLGSSSIVAQLAELNDPNFHLNETTPYAELWMTNHVNGPAVFKISRLALKQELPFMLKVICVAKALSIQIHPNKAQSLFLNSKFPEIYRDVNHKPELAVALTPFVALCGFRTYSEIRTILMTIYPLKVLAVGDSDDMDLLAEDDEQGVRNCYNRLMSASFKDVGECINEISQNYWKELCHYDILEIFNKLKNDFPNDIGVLSLFFMNIVRLKPGDAIFTSSNELHCYLSGDCIECTANSDNVIRAGLTPKFKDVTQLLSLVSYKGAPAESQIFTPQRIDDQRLLFAPPVEDFALTQITLQSNDTEYILKVEQGPGILLVLSGKRVFQTDGYEQLQLKRGSIIYLPCEIGADLRFIKDGEDEENFWAFYSTPNIPQDPAQ